MNNNIYITLQSIRKNLGLFNLEAKDLIIFGVFLIIFTILFLLEFYTISIIIISFAIISLIPTHFGKCNRIYKIFILFVKYLIRDKHYYFYRIKGE